MKFLKIGENFYNINLISSIELLQANIFKFKFTDGKTFYFIPPSTECMYFFGEFMCGVHERICFDLDEECREKYGYFAEKYISDFIDCKPTWEDQRKEIRDYLEK